MPEQPLSIRGVKREKIATLIITFNRKNLLFRSLDANRRQTRPADAIFVVDNASTDGTHAALRARGYLDLETVRYIPLSTNTGSAGGYHEGLERAVKEKFDWVWVMDDDALPAEDALERLLVARSKLPSEQLDRLSVIASAVRDFDGRIVEPTRRFLNRYTLKETPAAESLYQKPYFEVDLFSGTGGLISREAIERAGFPRRDYFFSYDDTEYSLRIKRGGGVIVVVPDSVITHRSYKKKGRHDPGHHNCFTFPSSLRRYYRHRNRVHLYMTYARHNPISYLKALYSAVVTQTVILMREPHKLGRSRLCWRSILDGLCGRLGKSIDPASFAE